MADIRCPKCGAKLSPTARVCNVCGNFLDQAADDTPDWLRELSGSGSGGAPSENSPDQAPQDGGAPDWLARIRARKEEEQTSQAADDVDAPDWLREIKGETTPGTAGGQEDVPDWLADLSPRKTETQPAAGEEPAPGPASADESDEDWLKKLSAFGSPETEVPAAAEPAPAAPFDFSQPATEGGSDDNEWLHSLQSQSYGDESQPEPAVELPTEQEAADWLNSLSATAETAGVEPAAETPAAGEELDWMNAFQAAAPEAAAPQPAAGEENLDWLAALGSATAETAGVEPAAETPAAGEELDWMNAFQVAAPEAATPEPAASEENLDWLAALGSATAETAGTGPAAETPTAGEGLDWLNAFEAAAPEEVAAQVTPEPAAGEGNLDWMAALGTAVTETAGVEPLAETPAAEESADWLSAFQAAPAAEGALEPLAETPAAEESADWLSAFQAPPTETEPAAPAESGTGLPDWLNAFGETPALEGESTRDSGIPDWMNAISETPSAEMPLVEPATAVPDWLSGFSQPSEVEETSMLEPQVDALQPETPAAAPVSPFALDIPDWLIGGEAPALPETASAGESLAFTDFPLEAEQAQATPFTSDSGAEETPQDLEPAQLPGWLAAMRPVEAVAPVQVVQENDSRVEQAGPLAGLAGILQGEDLVRQYSRPPVYSSRLKLTERQRQNVALFESLISQETQPKAVRAESGVHPRRVLRLVIGLLLLGIVLFSLFTRLPIFLPKMQTPESVGFITHVTALTIKKDPRVMVAVDYQPSLAGEMKMLSQQVLEDLMKNNAVLAVMSTQSSGPAMADDLLRSAQAAQSSYSLADRSVNLGYLPGGATGLQQLGIRIQQAMPATWDGQPAWNLPQLAGINALGDFDAVILVTDDPAVARTWVEQTGTALGSKPLLVISSSQAAPLILPFTQSGQITGMMSGMTGGALYEKGTGRLTGQVSIAWSAYQNGILLMVVLILFGAIYQVISGLANRSRSKKRA